MLMLDPEIKSLFSQRKSLFKQIMALRGEVFRELENRRTQRVMLDNKKYFLKQHFGVGWKEIFKNLFQWRLPIVDAHNEWEALERLQALHIPVPKIAGYGHRGFNPARRQSFILTHELPSHISLEDFCKNWKTNPPSYRLKQQLIKQVARMARVMHENGINHRDFYLCHFLLDLAKPVLYLIDLHRAQVRQIVPERWLIKDLAGLYFSSQDIGLTRRDLLRFMKEYRNKSLELILIQERNFWERVKKRGDKLYQRHSQ